jgi:excisionase family DNA binding protein
MAPKRARRVGSDHDRATYTVSELTRVLGLSRAGVYAALKDGTIPHLRVGRRFVVPKAAINALFIAMGQQTGTTGSSRH